MYNSLKKLDFLITKRQKKGIVILIFLLFFGILFEIFGLGIISPAISILLDPLSIQDIPILLSIKKYISNYTSVNFTFIFLAFIFFIYLFKAIYLVFLTYIQNRFLANVIANISNNLFYNYMHQPYSFHLNKNSSELIKNLQIEIIHLNTFIFSLINLFTDGGILISILATLIYFEPVGAISIGIFYGLLSFLFLQFTKRKISNWGEIRNQIDKEISLISLEGLKLIKELIIFGKTSFFIEKYSIQNINKARLNTNLGTVSQMPKFYLEFISICGLLSFILFKLLQETNSTNLISIIGIFVAASFRIIPSVNKLLTSLQAIKFYSSSVEIIYSTLKDKRANKINDKSQFSFENQIEFKKVSFSYNKKIDVLNEINLKIIKGQSLGIIGESGSGKSTFIDLFIGLHKPSSGKIEIDCQENFQFTQSWKKNIGYVPQSIILRDDTIKNNIALGIEENEIDENQIKNVLKQVQLESFIKNLNKGINAKVGEGGNNISGGQRQRIGIARALYNNPSILIFDEATSALDQETEREVINTIKKLKDNKTIIFISHNPSVLTWVDKKIEIKNQKIKEL